MFTNDEDTESTSVKRLFLSERFSDCSILVKNSDSSTRFPVHKNILSLKSEVLADFLESSPEADGKVILMENINPDAVFKVLEHIYLGKTPIEDWLIADEVLKVAKKFKISKLIDQCEDQLMNKINLQNVCYIYQAAILNDSCKVMKMCTSVCAFCGFIILDTMGFRKANIDIVKRILLDPDLQIQSELQAFRAAWMWATYKCCKEQKTISDEHVAKEMKHLLYCIRFKSMSKEELNSIPEVVMKISHDSNINRVDGFKENMDTFSNSTLPVRKKPIYFAYFPSRILKHFSLFKFNISSSGKEFLEGNITLMKFSINTAIYLTEIQIWHVNFEENSASNISLRICNRNGLLSSFRGQYSWGYIRFSVKECRVLKAHEIYTIELNSDIENSDLYFHLCSLECKLIDDVQITLLTEKCFGIGKLIFAKAS